MTDFSHSIINATDLQALFHALCAAHAAQALASAPHRETAGN